MYSTPSNLLCTRYEQVIPVGALTADVKTSLLNETLYCGFMNSASEFTTVER